MPLAFYLLQDGDDWLVTDTGCVGMMRDLALPMSKQLALGSRVTRAVICHAHADHFGGNAELKDANPNCRIFVHEDDAAWAANPAFHIDDAYDYLGADFPCPTEVKNWLADILGAATPVETLNANDQLELANGTTLKVIHLPGHSPGHIGLWHAESGLLLASDAILGNGQLVDGQIDAIPSYLNVEAYLNTIETLRKLEPKVMATAHYPIFYGEEVMAFCDLSERFVKQLAEVLWELLTKQAWNLQDLTTAALAKLTPSATPSIAAAFSIQAHLDQFEADGTATFHLDEGVRWWVARERPS